jgi:Spy/CpxP family protein refolding chaperone
MIDLGSLLDQKSPNRGAISAKVDEIGGIRKQMMMYRVDTLLKLKEILTPEQYAQFRSQIKAQMERGMGGMMGHGKMGGYAPEKDEN